MNLPQPRPRFVIEQAGGLVGHLRRSLGEQEPRVISEFMRILRTRLEHRHRPRQQVAINLAIDAVCELRSDQIGKPRIVRLADIVAVEVLQLL